MSPYLAPQQRQQGGWAATVPDPHDGGPCRCDWTTPTGAANLAHRQLPTPDHNRYGPAGTVDSPRFRADGVTRWPHETKGTDQ